MPELALSVLDIGPIRTNQSLSDFVASTCALARAAEALGYRRYWLAEHHNVGAVAASHTAVLAAAIAARTERIRLGGCVLLPHYPTFLVAEQMALLEAMAPGRVDLGIGRSTGADAVATALLRGGAEFRSHHDHARAIGELGAMLESEGVSFDISNDWKGENFVVKAAPGIRSAPAIWVLGTSVQSAIVAAELGLPYAFGYHITGENVDEALDVYRSRFRPSAACDTPKSLLSAIVVVGPSAEEAERRARSQLLFMAQLRSGERTSPQLLIEEAEEVPFAERHAGLIAMFRKTWIIGDGEEVASQIRALADRLGLDEFMVNPVAAAQGAHDPARAPHREETLETIARHLARVKQPAAKDAL